MRKRSYQQNCALARASDLLGERWTLLIFRELLIQPCRYRELNQYLTGMGTNLLAQRLKELETEGLIEKVDPCDKRSEYQLTQAGWSVESVVLAIVRWGLGRKKEEANGAHFHHWDLLAMKALFNLDKCQHDIAMQFSCEQFTGWCVVGPMSGCNIGMGYLDDANTSFDGTVLEFQAYMSGAGRAGPHLWHKFTKCFQAGSKIKSQRTNL